MQSFFILLILFRFVVERKEIGAGEGSFNKTKRLV
jgi:hypothetical protein